MSQTLLNERVIKHQIFVQRHGGHLSNLAMAQLAKIEREIVRRLDTVGSDYFELRLMALAKSIIKIYDESNLAIDQISSLEDFAIYEHSFTGKMITASSIAKLDYVDPAQLVKSLADSKISLVSGKRKIKTNLAGMYKKLGKSIANNISSTIATGVSLGDTTDKIISDVKQISFKRSRNEIEAVVRTATNHTANQARMELIGENQWMFNGYKFLATLDSRTSLICAGLDGEVLPLSTRHIPPLHYNCRSALSPNIRDKFLADPGGGVRSSQFGPVDSRISYDGFLRKQTKEYQNEVLGYERAKLFRKGLSIKGFTNRDGIIYNLKQLELKDKLIL